MMYIFILSANFNVSNLFGIYEIGDTMLIMDQQVPHEICYGDLLIINNLINNPLNQYNIKKWT